MMVQYGRLYNGDDIDVINCQVWGLKGHKKRFQNSVVRVVVFWESFYWNISRFILTSQS